MGEDWHLPPCLPTKGSPSQIDPKLVTTDGSPFRHDLKDSELTGLT